MSILENDLHDEVADILQEPWDIRNGRVVPETTDVKLAGGGVKLDATFLYADMQESSRCVSRLGAESAAKVIKSFLECTTTMIRDNGGTITSFDGDRVMGVFLGAGKEECAAQVALMIAYAASEIVQPELWKYSSEIQRIRWRVKAGVGVDTGEVLAVRAGQRNDNDLIWIGAAPNRAAELSSIRRGAFHSHISLEVYRALGRTFLGEVKTWYWRPTTLKWLGKSIRVFMSRRVFAPVALGNIYGY